MMLHENIGALRDAMPRAFQQIDPPEEFDRDWTFQSIEGPTRPELSDAEERLSRLEPDSFTPVSSRDDMPSFPSFENDFPGAPEGKPWNILDAVLPDSPHTAQGTHQLHVDIFAFYLPFHLFGDLWGIYLIADRVPYLAHRLFVQSNSKLSSGSVSWPEALSATRLYLYHHEYFHHIAETFSSKLEVAHRTYVYLSGQRLIYQNSKYTDANLEETLAEAYALKKVRETLTSSAMWKCPVPKRDAFFEALLEHVAQGLPGYRKGAAVYRDKTFIHERNRFAEKILDSSPAKVPNSSPAIWKMFGHGFRGVADVTSRVKYAVRTSDSISSREPLVV